MMFDVGQNILVGLVGGGFDCLVRIFGGREVRRRRVAFQVV
jgi:hypothetical protein